VSGWSSSYTSTYVMHALAIYSRRSAGMFFEVCGALSRLFVFQSWRKYCSKSKHTSAIDTVHLLSDEPRELEHAHEVLVPDRCP